MILSAIKKFNFSNLRDTVAASNNPEYKEGDLLTYKYFSGNEDITIPPVPPYQIKAIINGVIYVSRNIVVTTSAQHNHWTVHIDMDK